MICMWICRCTRCIYDFFVYVVWSISISVCIIVGQLFNLLMFAWHRKMGWESSHGVLGHMPNQRKMEIQLAKKNTKMRISGWYNGEYTTKQCLVWIWYLIFVGKYPIPLVEHLISQPPNLEALRTASARRRAASSAAWRGQDFFSSPTAVVRTTLTQEGSLDRFLLTSQGSLLEFWEQAG